MCVVELLGTTLSESVSDVNIQGALKRRKHCLARTLVNCFKQVLIECKQYQVQIFVSNKRQYQWWLNYWNPGILGTSKASSKDPLKGSFRIPYMLIYALWAVFGNIF